MVENFSRFLLRTILKNHIKGGGGYCSRVYKELQIGKEKNLNNPRGKWAKEIKTSHSKGQTNG